MEKTKPPGTLAERERARLEAGITFRGKWTQVCEVNSRTEAGNLVGKYGPFEIYDSVALKTPNGERHRGVVKRTSGVIVIPFDADRNMLYFIKQYREVFGSYFLEFPGGEVGKNTPENAANKKLLEEAGISPRGDMVHRFSSARSSAFLTETTFYFSVFVNERRNITEELPSTTGTEHTANEIYQVQTKHILSAIKNGLITDSRSIEGALWAVANRISLLEEYKKVMRDRNKMIDNLMLNIRHV